MIKNYQQKMIELLILENDFSKKDELSVRREFIKLFNKFNNQRAQYFCVVNIYYLLLDFDEFRIYSENIIIAKVDVGTFYSIRAEDL